MRHFLGHATKYIKYYCLVLVLSSVVFPKTCFLRNSKAGQHDICAKVATLFFSCMEFFTLECTLNPLFFHFSYPNLVTHKIVPTDEFRTDELQPEPTRAERLFPDFINGVVFYDFPATFGVGIVANILSFVLIQMSDIRVTWTGVYLSVLACSDSVCLTLWTSLLWATPVLGLSFPGLHMCNVSQLGMAIFGSLSAMSIVCVLNNRQVYRCLRFPLKDRDMTWQEETHCLLCWGSQCLF